MMLGGSGAVGLGSGGGITCLAASELNEWNSDNVILTGSADGVVRVSLNSRSQTCANYGVVVYVQFCSLWNWKQGLR